MDQVDRDKIQANIKTLITMVNLNELSTILIKRGVIDREFVERIKVYSTVREQAQEFFLRYTKRGPEAFRILVQSLRDTGHISEAQLLDNRDRLSASSLECLESPSECSNSSSSNGSSHCQRFAFESPVSSSSSPSPASSTNASSANNRGDNEFHCETSMFSSRIVAIPPSEPMSELNISGFPLLNISVKASTDYNQGNIEDAYQMMSRPRGFALIINNINFAEDPESTRTGAEIDSDNLSKLLTELGFEVTIRHNVTKEELLNAADGILKRFIDKFCVTTVDACVVAIMSHGQENYIRCSDAGERFVRVNEDIIHRFNNSSCSVLIKKPKIFIIQACRGDTRDKGVRVVTHLDGRKFVDESDALSTRIHQLSKTDESDQIVYPTNGDILICYSTVPGFVANRDIQRGTWYIQCLCETFAEHAHDTEIHRLLKKVGQRMGTINSEYDEKQMSSFKNIGFNLELYFNPGLYASTDSAVGNSSADVPV